MQHRIIFNKFTGIWVISSLMFISTAVVAGGYYSQQYPRYSQQSSSAQSDHRQTNPWLLPEKKQSNLEFQQCPDYQGQQYTDSQQSQNDQHTGQQKQGFGFVTPAILESLKQQQSKYQEMPGSDRSQQSRSRQPSRGYYGNSPYGMGYSTPIFGAPGYSPWGGGPDLLYRGEEYPWPPDAGVEGVAPVPSYDENSQPDDSNNTENQPTYQVFDPFTLLPNGN
jgi:hypothetical protein